MPPWSRDGSGAAVFICDALREVDKVCPRIAVGKRQTKPPFSSCFMIRESRGLLLFLLRLDKIIICFGFDAVSDFFYKSMCIIIICAIARNQNNSIF